MMSVLFEKVSELCKKKNVSFYALEKATNLADSSIKKWEKSPPSCDRLLRVAQYFDVSTDYLLGYTENPQSHKNNPQDLAIAAEKLLEVAGAADAAAEQFKNDLKKIIDTYHISAGLTTSEED